MQQTGTTPFHQEGRFRLDALLGRGATGVVYAAYDRDHDRHVALKVLTAMHPSALEGFKKEFRALQGVRHPNLIQLNELIRQGDDWFLAMELVTGTDFISHVFQQDAKRTGAFGVAAHGATTSDQTSTLSETKTSRPHAARALDPRCCDEVRLRSAFIQLARGLHALHAARKIHRDIKPSNVLVSDSGQLKLVDFGLVADLQTTQPSERGQLLGTPRYMSPEQRTQSPLTCASDWYSAGALLYEALTGSAPDLHPHLSPDEIRHALRDAGPPDLRDLCARLLALSPTDRPSGAEVLKALGEDPKSSHAAPLGAGAEAVFVGRSRELRVLTSALERLAKGEGSCVVIEGESGVGKSALLKEFARRASLHDPSLQIFGGRCFEQESLPFKAVDGLMDAIASELVTRERKECLRLLPPTAVLIGRAFPVLRKLNLPEDPALRGDLEPQRQRAQMFAAVRELFARLASSRRTILCLDDMQWTDADSIALLSAVMASPNAPALLLVVAKRPGGLFGEQSLSGRSIKLDVGNLTPGESRDLAETLLSPNANPGTRERLHSLTREANGHPMFLRELARQFDVARSGRRPPLRLDDALWSRISELPELPRRIVEMSAVAGRPVSLKTLRKAVSHEGRPELQSAEFGSSLPELRHMCLVRTFGTFPREMIEIYHDRIREAVLARMDSNVLVRSHSQLAHALLLEDTPDAETLAAHFRAAREDARAYEYALLAAAQAEHALAFDNAVRSYRLALELGAGDAERRRDILARLADALANAGRGYEAAEAYHSAGRDDDTLVGLHRQRMAAEQLLRSGHIEAGIAALSKVMLKLGAPLPNSRLRALASLLGLRAALAIKGFKTQRGSTVTTLESARIDGLWNAATYLTMFDNLRSAELQTRGIRRALEGGTQLQVLRAHTAEAIFQATAGERNRSAIEKVLAGADRLAAELGDPYGDGWTHLSRGASSFLLGDWRHGEEHCAAAESVFERRAGAAWELASSRAFGTWSAMMRGKFRALSVRVPAYVDEAEKRGDLYSATLQMTGFSNVAWLTTGDTAGARQMLALAERRWPSARFDVPRYLHMVAAAFLALYEADGAGAHARVLRDWRSLRWGIAFRAQITRFGMRTVRGLAALAAFDERNDLTLLFDAWACARAICSEGVTWSRCFGKMILAGVALRRGQPTRGLEHLLDAERCARAAGMMLHAAVIQLRRGELELGESGARLVRNARAFMTAEKIAAPETMAAMLTPRLPPAHRS